MINELKLLSESLILESNIDFDQKNNLIKFVCESSSEEELKSLILDGSHSKIDEDSKIIINKRFDNLIENLLLILEQENNPKNIKEPVKKKITLPINPTSLIYPLLYLPASIKTPIIDKVKMALSVAGKYKGYIGGVGLAALIGYIAYKVYQNYLSKAAQVCKDMEDKSECMMNYKKKAKLLRIQQLQKNMTQCVKSKDPDKCRKSLSDKINKLKLNV